jgi:hypothetical protein
MFVLAGRTHLEPKHSDSGGRESSWVETKPSVAPLLNDAEAERMGQLLDIHRVISFSP